MFEITSVNCIFIRYNYVVASGVLMVTLTALIISSTQLNFNGSNTFGTMKICLRQGLSDLMRQVRRQNRDIFSIFFNMKV